MSLERVKNYLGQFGLSDRIMEFDTSTATVELAAEAAGCEPERIAKTLAFMVNSTPVLVVAAGDVRIDNRKFKDEFKSKAKMLSPTELLELVGHNVGGVCPFAIKDGVEVYLDNSLRRFETVFPACGTDNTTIELSLEELEKTSGFKNWVDVGKY
ncbi:YbaK/EbsC family protein [Microaceticoccus formicicus]|uniref:YbaK/EbsC family protein n=1 Tax=Microaceticoccus formicicus TaxID=3118105 RepID=UPI003CD004CB|nr:YbaK/EbsC family protein [Peptoniphilaceae bacterium AMB_02]